MKVALDTYFPKRVIKKYITLPQLIPDNKEKIIIDPI